MTRASWLAAIGLIVAVWVGTAVVYGSLPDRVPTHWNIRGQVDAHGPKALAALLMPAVMVGMLALFAALPWLSPAQFKLEGFRSTYGFIAVVVLAMQAFIHTLLLLAAMGYQFDMSRWLVAGTLFGLGLMGNVMGKVRRNFYVGFRVPWTLASERVWNETNRLAAWLTFGVGLLGSAVALMGYPLVALSSLVLIVVIPTIFSLLRYKQLERSGEI
ncbi:Uncharacterized membrane protein [Singulisphaera sp. GP187]|uniref:SdpI family protein n=1 Tax=Singulisphaera sp. GP187 TaxID=1882752 RepID=UPI0009280D2C|nr:DUF1648 domain-containing protein [Singulisphaera sp. GP187]SIO34072.1 Uncharacterized membrane protein [Singulisphaera sp. GP187]